MSDRPRPGDGRPELHIPNFRSQVCELHYTDGTPGVLLALTPIYTYVDDGTRMCFPMTADSARDLADQLRGWADAAELAATNRDA